MNLLRKILGLGPKEPINVVPRKETPRIKVADESNLTPTDEDIFPVLVSLKTKEFDLLDELVATFHGREDNYADVVIAHVLVDKRNSEETGEEEVFHIKTEGKDEDFCRMLLESGERNLDNLELPFEFWNPTDEELEYKILSCRISFFASQKIMCRKHMLEAHRILNADELLVSIPRRGLIFVCDRNIAKEHYEDFLNIHAYTVLQENEELEFLCEDVFVIKDGEIEGVLKNINLSKALNAQK